MAVVTQMSDDTNTPMATKCSMTGYINIKVERQDKDTIRVSWSDGEVIVNDMLVGDSFDFTLAAKLETETTDIKVSSK